MHENPSYLPNYWILVFSWFHFLRYTQNMLSLLR